jgi:hypothetical protein
MLALSKEDRDLLMSSTFTPESATRRGQLVRALLTALDIREQPTADVPLFAGEPERCALCGRPGHTHDDHWLLDEVEHRLGLRTCTPLEHGILEAAETVPNEAIGKYGASPGDVWQPVRCAIRAERESRGVVIDPPSETILPKGRVGA